MKDNEVYALAMLIVIVCVALFVFWRLAKMHYESERYEDAFAAKVLKEVEDEIFKWHQAVAKLPHGAALSASEVMDEIEMRFPAVFDPIDEEPEVKEVEA